MNRSIWMPILAIVVSIIAFSHMVASTGSTPQNHPEHLEVSNGEGSGDYLEGDQVPILVVPPEGMSLSDFLYWEIVTGDGELQNEEELNATYVMGLEPAIVRAVFDNAGDAPSKSYFLGTDETTGPKYRKIGLNGFPIPDEKPQATEETDEEPEETFIDGFNHTLTHQTTDIYIPMMGTDLALAVRRNWQPEIWNTGSGLSIENRPDRPFGAGWRTNICATLEFIIPFSFEGLPSSRPTVTVTDENGVSYRFMFFGVVQADDETYRHRFLPLAENRHQQEVMATQLEDLGNGQYRFTRKMGSTLRFSISNIQRTAWSRSRTNEPPKSGTNHRWARLDTVSDRFGNTMVYGYQNSPSQIFPSKISMRGKEISIEYGENGLVEIVTDPKGIRKIYSYADYPYNESRPEDSFLALSGVEKAPGLISKYRYSLANEIDPTPRDPADRFAFISKFFYCDLAEISDPSGNSTSFGYKLDKSRLAFTRFTSSSGMVIGKWFRPAGNPRNVASVSTPGGSASFSNDTQMRLSFSNISPGGQPQPEGSRTMSVVDAKGGKWSWVFSDGEAINMLDFAKIPDGQNFSKQLMILFKTMEVFTPEDGYMVATFEKSAGMALKSFQDVGASEPVTFEYTDQFNFAERQPWLQELGPLLALYPVQYWGDPTKQVDANGKEKTFSYDQKWRVMDKIVDEESRTTEYEIDPANGNRLKETVSGAGGPFVTNFGYGNSNFPGILTSKSIVGGINGHTSSGPLVTRYFPDPENGNILREKTGDLPESVHTYDANNNKKSVTDPRGKITSFEYDDLNRLRVIDPPGPGNREIRYDLQGNKKAEKDENGIWTLRQFDGLGRVIVEARDMNRNETIDAPDLITRFGYNVFGSKEKITDPRGNVTNMAFDGLNRLTQTTDALLYKTTFEYGANSGGIQFGKGFQPTLIIDARNFKTRITYDNNFRETQRSMEYEPETYATTVMKLDDVGNAVQITDPLGIVTKHTYDALNRKTSTTFMNNSTVSTHYNGAGRVWKTVDELGHTSLVDFDSAGREVTTYSPSVDDGHGAIRRAETHMLYDDAGNVLFRTNPLGHTWGYTYDERNRKLTETPPGSPVLKWTYDNVGNVKEVTDARGKTTTTSYDDAYRPWKVEQPMVRVFGGGDVRPTTITIFDKNGNPERVTDPNQHTTVNIYDALNRLKTTTDAENIKVTNEYDGSGNLVAVIDGKGQRTDFSFDGLKRNKSIRDALGRTTRFEYDAVNKTARVDSQNQRTEYRYDLRNRLEKSLYIKRETDNRTLAYDLVGNLLSVTEARPEACVAYTYDALRRQTTETSNGVTHTYKHDLAGNRIFCSYGQSGITLISEYDPQNRLKKLIEGNKETSYTYDDNGNQLTKTLPNGDRTTSVYDAANRTTSLIGTSGQQTLLNSYQYEYDPAGNVKSVSETYPDPTQNRVVTNDYDSANRLKTETVTGSGAEITRYEYDDAHNRSSMTRGTATTSYAYNDINQLTESSAGNRTVSFGYDLNGNRIRRTEGAAVDSFSWDYENRLVGLNKQSTNGVGEYAWGYDYRTRRVSLQTPETPLARVVFSGGTSVQEIENGAPVVNYVRGSDWGGGVGGILYSLRDGTPSFTHYNRRGDVTAKTNESGTLTYSAKYEAFGSRTSETGSTQDRQKSNTKDEDIPGYANEGFRFRDLETGSFVSKDPAGFVDGPNLYAYVVQNPWTKFDPRGLQSYDPSMGRQGYSPTAAQLFMPATVGSTRGPWSGSMQGDIGHYNQITKSNLGLAASVPVGAVAGGMIQAAGPVAVAKEAGGEVFQNATGIPIMSLRDVKDVVDIGRGLAKKAGDLVETAKTAYQKSRFASETGSVGDLSVWRTLDGQTISSEDLASGHLSITDTGSYSNLHASGKTYDGKGNLDRAAVSADEKSFLHDDPLISTDWTPAASHREAFKQESLRLDSHGGAGSGGNYNKIDSPGKKIREEDAE